MKKSIVIPSIIIIAANVIFGLILSKYEVFNVCASSAAVAVTAVMMNLLYVTKLRTAFRISLIVLFLLNGVISFILSILSPNTYVDNGYLIAIVVLLAIQVIMWVLCTSVSKSVKE